LKRHIPYLVDVDDVIIPWRDGFLAWMKIRGTPALKGHELDYSLAKAFPKLTETQLYSLVEDYACSDHYRCLEPVSGAIEKMRELRAFRPNHLFIAVTACGRDPAIQANRNYQLRNCPFDGVIPVGLAVSKLTVYQQFAPAIVLEDSTKQIKAAQLAGHFVIGFRKPWNTDAQPSMWVDNWSEIDAEALP
jgi:hypothetical protein